MKWRSLSSPLLIGFLLLQATCAHHSVSEDTVILPEAPSPNIIPLSVHYLTDQGDIRRKFEQSFSASNDALKPHGIGLTVWSEDHLYLLPHDIHTKQDRQLLEGRIYDDGTLHVFVVDEVSLKPGDGLNGLYTGNGSTNFIILATTARKTTLAHEVGHALGLDHSTDTNNIMCTNRTNKGPIFTEEQGHLMRQGLYKRIKRIQQETSQKK